MITRSFRAILLASLLPIAANAQSDARDASAWTASIASNYWIAPNISYVGGDSDRTRLDVFVPRGATPSSPAPAVIFFHGGGWEGGDKSVAVLQLLPYLEMGWAAVNVEYRVGRAPAAVEDGRCALRWVIRNASKYNIDIRRLVVSGESAGGHLALTTGMLPATAGLDERCPGSEALSVAAIVNWNGITDVYALIEGVHQQGFAMRWMAGAPEPQALARKLSPVLYVRGGLPPIISIHGDADQVAPYALALRLHAKLDSAHVPNQLVTHAGGNHGGFTREQRVASYVAIRDFLGTHVLRK